MHMGLRGVGAVSFVFAVSLAMAAPEPAHAGNLSGIFYRRMLSRKLRALEQGPNFSALGDGPGRWSAENEHAQNIQAGTFDQAIDHLNPRDKRTFKQRYYISADYATDSGSPVFYVICGEAPCTEDDLGGAVDAYAQRFHAYIVALEHRFYGESQPTGDLAARSLKYLSVEQALADLEAFQDYARQTLGLHGKWVSFGGSYPGALSAYYRQKFPGKVIGALASSAPVQARENFELYDWTVTQQAGTACAAAMRKAVQLAQGAASDPAKLRELERMFNADGIVNPVDFLYVMADMGAMAVQYGMKDLFCGELLANGDVLRGYATAGLDVFSRFGLTPIEDSFQAAESIQPSDYMKLFGMRAWMYQSCAEFGYFQVAYHDPAFSTRSALIDLNFHYWVCQHLFGLNQAVPEAQANRERYEPILDRATSNILFTNGSQDPWANLSISQANGNAVNPNLSLYTVDGGSHCNDLYPPREGDSDSLAAARKTMVQLLQGWL